jgi:hypothetical protein
VHTTRVTTTGVASVGGVVWGSSEGGWYGNEVAGQCYVPVSFKYLP